MKLFLFLFLFVSVESYSELHNLMDDEELKFYFGSDKHLPDYEIVNLPENLLSVRESVINENESGDNGFEKSIRFKVFNKQVKLNLQINKHLISPYAKIVTKTLNETKRILNAQSYCHYIHVDLNSTAAISNCAAKEIHGLIFLPNETLEILPLSDRLNFIIKRRESISKENIQQKGYATVPHLVKRSSFTKGSFENDFLVRKFRSSTKTERLANFDRPNVEIGLFFDEAFYRFFSPFFNNDCDKLRNFILSYINGVQSLYYHSSLGRQIDFTIVYIEIMEEQPIAMPHANGERNALIDNFCDYQKSLNGHQENWDMAVYVSGLDFFAWDSRGNKNGVTMGLATVSGVCNDDYNCIIAEFGSINHISGNTYPSSGYTAVYILAHEIGHNLGMSHDSTGNLCSKEGYIMSPTRGTRGETTWSKCSESTAMKLDWAKCLFDTPSTASIDLDPWIFNGYPGTSYTAKDQCEILLRDKEAYVFINGHQSTICDNLHCRTPKRPGFFFAGPALQGTDCGFRKWCQGGTCVDKTNLIKTTTEAPQKPIWGPWKKTQCISECLIEGKGFQKNRRFCIDKNKSCGGVSISFSLCDDKKICGTRKSVTKYATMRCKEFSRVLPNVDGEAVGLQASYESLRLWMPCAVFCKRSNTTSYYTPRVELNELDPAIDPYLPDGTLCHKEGNESFYCLQHHCLPESTMLMKTAELPTK